MERNDCCWEAVANERAGDEDEEGAGESVVECWRGYSGAGVRWINLGIHLVQEIPAKGHESHFVHSHSV